MRPLCAVSVDLDPLRCYYEIHDLELHTPALSRVVLSHALPRFATLFERHGIHATFFVVGADLEEDAAACARLQALARAGHELGNHSYAHRYDLGRLGHTLVRDELERAHTLISEVAGRAPVGFRAPGYDLSPTMLAVLTELGYRYDSSILPAPFYYAAKAAVMGWMALGRRRSGAVLGAPGALVAPRVPYRPSLSGPWRRGEATLMELPISVTPKLRLPIIGTSLLVAPPWLRARLLCSATALPLFNFELHGIDLIDTDEDGIPMELAARQPDLRLPLAVKQRVLGETLERLAEVFDFVPLCRVAETWRH